MLSGCYRRSTTRYPDGKSPKGTARLTLLARLSSALLSATSPVLSVEMPIFSALATVGLGVGGVVVGNLILASSTTRRIPQVLTGSAGRSPQCSQLFCLHVPGQGCQEEVNRSSHTGAVSLVLLKVGVDFVGVDSLFHILLMGVFRGISCFSDKIEGEEGVMG